MRYAIGVAIIIAAVSVAAQQTPRITAECTAFLKQHIQQGADIDALLTRETVQDMSQADWTECRTAALVRLEAHRKAVAERARQKAEREKQRGKVGEFVQM